MREAALCFLRRLPRAIGSGGAEKAPARGNARLHSGHLLRKRRDLGFYKHPYLTFPSSRLPPWAFRPIPCLFTQSEQSIPAGPFSLSFHVCFFFLPAKLSPSFSFFVDRPPFPLPCASHSVSNTSAQEPASIPNGLFILSTADQITSASGRGRRTRLGSAGSGQVTTKKQRVRFKRRGGEQKNGLLEDTCACIRGYARDGAGAFRE